MAFCCDITGISDEILSFLGYNFVLESDEFKIYRDKYAEDYIVDKVHPYIYVEDYNDALCLRAARIIKLPPNVHMD